MLSETLIGLFLQVKTFLNINSAIPEIPKTMAAIPSPLSSVALPSTDIQIPSPKPSKAPAIKKPKPSPEVKSVQASTLTKESVLQDLNEYRSKNGAGNLQFDDKLQNYAQFRADYLKSIGKLDKHAGHQAFMKNDGFSKLGFNAVAENQGWNYKGDATGLIEKFYGSSSGHNKNQLNSQYTHVGIGINGPFTNLVFGGKEK